MVKETFRKVIVRLALWVRDVALTISEKAERIAYSRVDWINDPNDPLIRQAVLEPQRLNGMIAETFARHNPWVDVIEGGVFPPKKGDDL